MGMDKQKKTNDNKKKNSGFFGFVKNIFSGKKKPAPKKPVLKNPIQYKPRINSNIKRPYYVNTIKPEPINIQFDDKPLIRREKKVKKEEILDVDEMINMKLKTRFKKIQRLKKKQKIPLMISIKTDEVEVDDDRVGLDLVVMIDTSGSMNGEKIKLVRETLLTITKNLTKIDRLGLIKFSTSPTLLLNLTPVSKL